MKSSVYGIIFYVCGKMKGGHLIVLLIFLSLSAFLILTPAEYVQCPHEYPDECLDFSGIHKHSIKPISGPNFYYAAFPFWGPYVRNQSSQYHSLEMLNASLDLFKLVLSTVLLRQ